MNILRSTPDLAYHRASLLFRSYLETLKGYEMLKTQEATLND